MVRIAAEHEDVPLADPQVLEELSGRVRTSREFDAPKLLRPVGKNGAEVHMRILPVEKSNQVFA